MGRNSLPCLPGPALGTEHHERGAQCGRSSLTKSLFGVSSSDLAKSFTIIRSCAVEKNLAGARRCSGLESAKQSVAEMDSVIYNAVLDACVACQDIEAAKEWIKKDRSSRSVQLSDVWYLFASEVSSGRTAKTCFPVRASGAAWLEALVLVAAS